MVSIGISAHEARFRAEGFDTLAEVQAAELNDDDLKELGLRTPDRQRALSSLPRPPNFRSEPGTVLKPAATSPAAAPTEYQQFITSRSDNAQKSNSGLKRGRPPTPWPSSDSQAEQPEPQPQDKGQPHKHPRYEIPATAWESAEANSIIT